MSEQYGIPIIDLDPYLPNDLEGAPSREEILAATQRAMGNHVSIPANDGMEHPRVHMSRAEAEEFEASLRPHVDKLIEAVRSGEFRQRLLGVRAVEQASTDNV